MFPGDSELASRMRELDWTSTKLGHPNNWPVTLRTALGICLASRFPMHIWWGSDLTLLYNDAFAKLLGPKKHPSALAHSGRPALAEVWDQLSPMVDRAFRERVASGVEDMRLFLDRTIPHEEVFVTLSFSPIVGETGVDGMFCTWTETTDKLIAARRLETLRRLGALTGGRTVISACEAVGEVLASNADDIPFAVLYLIEGGVPRATTWVRLAPDDAGARQAIDEARIATLDAITELEVNVAHHYWPEAITRALAIPIRENMALSAVLVCGVSPRRPLMPTYRGFFDLVASHVGASLASAHAFEQEQQRVRALAELARTRTLFFANITEQLRAVLDQLRAPIQELLAKPHDPATLDSLHLIERSTVQLRSLLETEELDVDAAADKLESIALTHARNEASDARAEARAKDDFLSLFGHELRNPLSTLLVALDVIARQTPSIETTLMDRAVRHLARLVDDLLDLSRLHRGKIALHRTACELAQVVDLALERGAKQIEERAIQVFVRVPRTGLGVDCDPERIAQVIGNVLANATKFSTKGGKVTIEAKRIAARVQLTIRDEGVGIASDQLARVFEPFQDRTTHAGSLGLGLAIARNLVELHGGELTVASEGEDKGTEVTIDLPFTPARESQPIVAAPKKPRKRVLLVEDNHDTAVALQRALESLGYQVALAHNGPVALTVARAFKPDVALLDINLPVMDGWELSRRLRELDVQAHELQFVAVTARDQDQDKQRSAEAGFADHLVKPIDLAALERVVESLPDPPRDQ